MQKYGKNLTITESLPRVSKHVNKIHQILVARSIVEYSYTQHKSFLFSQPIPVMIHVHHHSGSNQSTINDGDRSS